LFFLVGVLFLVPPGRPPGAVRQAGADRR
jgi:hypothetical protein